MKKIFVVLVSVIMLISVFTMTACSDENPTYDAGEYGEVVNYTFGTPDVKCKEGYRFLGWSEPVKEGRKTICKAQYEHIEYYLSEVKDVYVLEQGYQYGPNVISKVTNLQTTQEKEFVVDLLGSEITTVEYFGNDSVKLENSPIAVDQNDKGQCFYAHRYPYEFDVTAKVQIENPLYNITANFELHFVRNRIPAESMSVEVWTKEGNNVVSVGGLCRFYVTFEPDNTSYTECEYRLLTISRDGYDLDEELIKETAYFDNFNNLQITDKAKAGDLIYIQVVNKRDPQVKSDIIEIYVY